MAESCISERKWLRNTKYIQTNTEYTTFMVKFQFQLEKIKIWMFWIIFCKNGWNLHLRKGTTEKDELHTIEFRIYGFHSKTSFSAKNKKSDCFWLIIAKKDCYLHLNGTIIAVKIFNVITQLKIHHNKKEILKDEFI